MAAELGAGWRRGPMPGSPPDTPFPAVKGTVMRLANGSVVTIPELPQQAPRLPQSQPQPLPPARTLVEAVNRARNEMNLVWSKELAPLLAVVEEIAGRLDDLAAR